MSILDLLRTAPPQPAADVINQATRAARIVDQQLVEIVRLLDRPTQPTTTDEDQQLRTLRRSVLSARIHLGRLPR